MPIRVPKTPRYRASASPIARLNTRYADLRPAQAQGQSIVNMGKVITLRANQMQQERDSAVSADIYNQWRDADREQLSELLAKKGKDAAGLDQSYDEFFNKSQGKADAQTENGRQQGAVNEMLNRKRAQNLDILARYQAQEGRRYKAEQQVGIVNNAVDDARDQGFDDAALESTISDTFDYLRTANPGMSDEVLVALQGKVLSQVLFANMQTRIDQDAKQALSDLEGRKEALGDGYFTLKAIAQAKQKSLNVEARIAKNAAKTAAKEAKAEAHDAEELEISNVLYFDKDPVRAALLLGRSAHIKGDEVAVWVGRIEKVAEGKKPEDPFKTSDPEYVDNLFEEAAAGFVDPANIRPLPGKLSREDYRLAKSIAEYATKPDTKYIMDLTKSVLKEGSNIIVGTDWMFIDKPDKSIKDKGTMERFIYSELVNAETDSEKMDLLDENSKNFVLRKAFQSIGRNYDKEKEQQPGFSSMFFEPGGQKKQEEITDVKQLWGEKVPKQHSEGD